MSNIEQIARLKVSVRKTRELIQDFILTGKINDENIPMVRGWIMDELEKRNPAAYEAWLDGSGDDESLYQYFHC